VDRWQHQVDVGDIGNAFKTPTGATVGHLQQFGVKQGTLFFDDIAKPILSGDSELRMMGLTRLGKAITLGGPANVATSLIKSGFDPKAAGLLMAATGGVAGIHGDLFRKLGNLLGGGPKWDSLGEEEIPATSVTTRFLGDLASGKPSGLMNAGLTAATAAQPTVGYLKAAMNPVMADMRKRERSSGTRGRSGRSGRSGRRGR
jgi:hypothetical protein